MKVLARAKMPKTSQQFMYETFNTPFYLQRSIEVNYSSFTAEWQIKGKSSVSYNDVAAYTTYGTSRANAYKILEDSLNLRDVRIYDTIEDADGKERRVLNAKETTLAAQKQQAIREAFRDWIWRDPERRQTLVRQYNEEMNSTRPREYDGSHITFGGMNPAITLREHQKSAIAHVLYGGNTLLAHEVGAGKTFEMKILKCLMMIVTAPVILVLTLFVWLCTGLIYISGLVLGLLSMVIALLGVAVLITYSPQNGVILLVMAFLISPMGLPMAAIWLLGKMQSLKFAIQDWVYE